MDLFEILVPILFIIIYFISSIYNKEDSKGDGAPLQEEDESELPERERGIQEEIRRKIRERAHGREETGQSEVGERHRYDPLRSEEEQAKESEEKPPPVFTPSSGDFQERMRRQQEEIDSMERKAKQIRSQADKRFQDLDSPKILPSDSYGKKKGSPYAQRLDRDSFRNEVIAGLKDSREFKKAFLAYEILGTPVGLRKEDKMGPLWQKW